MFSFNVPEIDTQGLHELLGSESSDVKLIDVRMPAEVAQGAIPGAQNIPLNTLPHRLHEVPADSTVVFYCRTGARSAQACAYVAAQGHENTRNLRGGIMAWVRGGLAVA